MLDHAYRPRSKLPPPRSFACCGRDWQLPRFRLSRGRADLEERGVDLQLEERVSSKASCAGSALTSAAAPPLPPGEKEWQEWSRDDPDNPLCWGAFKKWTTTLLSCVLTLLVSSVSTSYAIGASSQMRDLNCSRELFNLGLAMYVLGCALAPLLLAPLSEVYGRYPVYITTALIWTPSAGSTVVGGTIADLFDRRDRGFPMSLFAFSAFAGTGLGPAYGGYIAQRLGWRWIQWIQMMACGALTLAIAFFTHETRGTVLLSRRAARLRKTTGDNRYQCRYDAERASLTILVKGSLSRPLYLLATEPVVFFFALWIGFSWGVMYLSLEAVAEVLETEYSFSEGETGLAFLAILLGGFVGLASMPLQEKQYHRKVAALGPDARMYAACIGGLLLPFGIFIFAFSQGRGHFLGPLAGLTIVFAGIFTIYSGMFSYLADTYGLYASSALAGTSLVRNLGGFSFPLFTTALYKSLGYQWASFVAGMIGLALAVLPWVLLSKGAQIRAHSKFAKAQLRREEGKQAEM